MIQLYYYIELLSNHISITIVLCETVSKTTWPTIYKNYKIPPFRVITNDVPNKPPPPNGTPKKQTVCTEKLRSTRKNIKTKLLSEDELGFHLFCARLAVHWRSPFIWFLGV